MKTEVRTDTLTLHAMKNYNQVKQHMEWKLLTLKLGKQEISRRDQDLDRKKNRIER